MSPTQKKLWLHLFYLIRAPYYLVDIRGANRKVIVCLNRAHILLRPHDLKCRTDEKCRLGDCGRYVILVRYGSVRNPSFNVHKNMSHDVHY